jgi:hypothetical protein
MLTPLYRSSREPEMQLLAHMFVSGRQLTPRRYPVIPDAIAFPGFPSADWTVPLAENLVRRGLLTKTFFDRKHECDSCGSRRLTVREECPSCRSANLSQTALIHHYHCATLRPESEFRKGNALVCPKCSQHLRNYGKDYDKPGNAQVCGSCFAVTSEPEVGFICLDCDARTTGEATRTVDLFSYSITDDAAAMLTIPRKAIAAPVGIPASLVEELERAQTTGNVPMAVAEIRYGARNSIVEAKGSAAFEKLRQLFVENMINYLSDGCSHHAGDASDYLVLASFDDSLSRRLDRLLPQSEAILSDRLEPKLRIAIRSQWTPQ